MINEEMSVSTLIDQLLICRTSAEENTLCALARNLPEEQKLNIVERLGDTNVRLAATVAARTNLAALQQLELFEKLLATKQSNSIKYFVKNLFAVRLSIKQILGVLHKHQDIHTSSVNIAAYYFIGAMHSLKPKDRSSLEDVMRQTTPKAASESQNEGL